MRWRIYYGDGSTYSDRDGSPFDAPTVDVQVIAQEEATSERGWILIRGRGAPAGYYCWRADGWVLHDDPGFWDYLFHYRGPKHVIFGRTIDTALYGEIVGRAGREGLG